MKFEQVHNVVEEFKKFGQMYKLQYEELGRFGKDIQVDPNWTAYSELEEAQQLLGYIVRNEDSIIVGYANFILQRHLHYEELFALNDVFYLLPEYREGMLGYKFIKFIEKELDYNHVRIIVWSVKPQKDYSKLLIRLGYGLLEMNYFRRL